MESRVMTLVYSLCRPEVDNGALAALCAAACKRLEDRLAEGITVEDCASVFCTAASLIVMDWLKEARHWEGVTAVSTSTSSSKSSSESVSESASESASEASSKAVSESSSESASESVSQSTSVSQSYSDDTSKTGSSNSSSSGSSTGSSKGGSTSNRTSNSTSNSTSTSTGSSKSDGVSAGSSSSTRWDLSTIGQLERRALAMMEPYLKKEVGLYVRSAKG